MAHSDHQGAGDRARRRRWLLGLTALASAAVLLHTLADTDGWARRSQLQQDLERLRAENSERQAEVEQLGAQLEALKNRADVQERAVREELGYLKPGEVILKLPERPQGQRP